MNKRQRLLTTMRQGTADTVPVCPDISMMYPCKYADKPFWEVLFFGNPPTWRMQIDLSRRFDFEAIVTVPGLAAPQDGRKSVSILERTNDHLLVEETYRTKTGSLSTTTYYPCNRSPWKRKALVSNIPDDLPSVRNLLFTDVREMTMKQEETAAILDYLGDDGVECVHVSAPTNWWLGLRLPQLEEGIMDWFIHASAMDKLMAEYSEWSLAYLDAVCKRIKPSLIYIGGSRCSLSLISPDLYRKYNLPYMMRATEICKSYGVLTKAHICGKSKDLLDMLAQDTDLDVIDPLEGPPGGDVDLREAKAKYGHRFILSGNVNTFATLAQGTPDMVRAEVKECILAAAAGGGFILATGDQVPYDCPEENFRAFVEAGREFGTY